MMSREASGIGRRVFLDRALALGAAMGLGSLARAEQASAAPRHGPPDEAWLRRLNGRHKQLFDAPRVDGGRALAHVRNYLNAYRDAYGLRDAQVSALLILYAGTVPLAFTDEAWAAYDLGKMAEIDDGAGRARRNVFRAPAEGSSIPRDAGLDALMQRGVVVVLCNNSFGRWTRDIAAAGHGTADEVRAKLLGWLLPGITLVPAAVLAVNRAQEAGCTYFFCG
jgi:intracellular sulfur oxidation DsrE/DsrF family protein